MSDTCSPLSAGVISVPATSAASRGSPRAGIDTSTIVIAMRRLQRMSRVRPFFDRVLFYPIRPRLSACPHFRTHRAVELS